MLPINEITFEKEFSKQLNTEIIANLDEEKSNEEYTIFTVKVKNRKQDKLRRYCDKNLEGCKFKIEETRIFLFGSISDLKFIELLKLCREMDPLNEINIFSEQNEDSYDTSLIISWNKPKLYKMGKPKNYDDIPF